MRLVDIEHLASRQSSPASAAGPNVRSMARQRTHTAGHKLSLATGGFRASHLSTLVQWATGRRRALGIDCDAATVTRAKAGIVASN